MKIGIDWDQTLVDTKTQEWLPGALERLRRMVADGDDVFVHTCHANWPEGRASVEAKLAQAGLRLRVEAKPLADVYIDDRAEKPEWSPPAARPAFRFNSSRPIPMRGRTRKIDGVYVY